MTVRMPSRLTKGITGALSVALVGGGLLLGAAPASAATNELSIAVTSSPTPVVAGSPIVYTATVTNAGTDSMSVLAASFPAGVTDISCDPAVTLYVSGDTRSCTGTYTPTDADIAAGSVTHTFFGMGKIHSSVVNGKDPLPVRSIITTAIEAPVATHAEVSIAATPDVDVVTPGNPVTYTTVVTNTGTSDLSVIGLFVPAGVTDVNCTPAATLTLGSYRIEGNFVPGDTLTCTSKYVPTDADVDAKTFTNAFQGGGRTAEVGDKDPLPVRTEVTTRVEVPVVEEGFAKVDVTVTPDTEKAVLGTPITYTATTENTGNVLFSQIVMGLPLEWTDVKCNVPMTSVVGDEWNVQIADGQFAPGDKLTCTGVYLPTQADVDRGTIDFPVIANAVNDPSVSETVEQAQDATNETSVPVVPAVVTPPVTETPTTNTGGNATPVAATGNLAYTGSDSAPVIVASIFALMSLIAGAALVSARHRSAA